MTLICIRSSTSSVAVGRGCAISVQYVFSPGNTLALDHTGCAGPTWQHELCGTDQGSVCATKELGHQVGIDDESVRDLSEVRCFDIWPRGTKPIRPSVMFCCMKPQPPSLPPLALFKDRFHSCLENRGRRGTRGRRRDRRDRSGARSRSRGKWWRRRRTRSISRW